MEKTNRKEQGYQLLYRKGFRLVTDYNITEAEYFEYYQNGCDPTFENCPFKLKVESITTGEISYYDTAVNILKHGNKLSIMTHNDFVNMISEWVFFRKWDFSHTSFFKNDGIPLITIKTDDQIGQLKCIWIIKKYSSKRPVGVKIIRELRYLISQTQASKGIIVTTSRLTKGALKLIDENRFIMSYIDNEMLEKELQKPNNYEDIIDDLLF